MWNSRPQPVSARPPNLFLWFHRYYSLVRKGFLRKSHLQVAGHACVCTRHRIYSTCIWSCRVSVTEFPCSWDKRKWGSCGLLVSCWGGLQCPACAPSPREPDYLQRERGFSLEAAAFWYLVYFRQTLRLSTCGFLIRAGVHCSEIRGNPRFFGAMKHGGFQGESR